MEAGGGGALWPADPMQENLPGGASALAQLNKRRHHLTWVSLRGTGAAGVI